MPVPSRSPLRDEWIFGPEDRKARGTESSVPLASNRGGSKLAYCFAANLLTQNTYDVLQVTPLSVKLVGIALVPFQVPLKPGAELTEAPGAIDPLYERLVTVTLFPDCEKVPPQSCVMVWPLAKLNLSVQPLIAVVPVLVMAILVPKPPGH